jgi:DNA polymerase beta
MKAATALQLYPKKIESGAEAMKLDGIGKKIAAKIDEIIKTGTLKKLEEDRKNPRIQACNQLCQVSGIGFARSLQFPIIFLNSFYFFLKTCDCVKVL